MEKTCSVPCTLPDSNQKYPGYSRARNALCKQLEGGRPSRKLLEISPQSHKTIKRNLHSNPFSPPLHSKTAFQQCILGEARHACFIQDLLLALNAHIRQKLRCPAARKPELCLERDFPPSHVTKECWEKKRREGATPRGQRCLAGRCLRCFL